MYVTNVDEGVEDEAFRAIFNKFGTIEKVSRRRRKRNRKTRSGGWITGGEKSKNALGGGY